MSVSESDVGSCEGATCLVVVIQQPIPMVQDVRRYFLPEIQASIIICRPNRVVHKWVRK